MSGLISCDIDTAINAAMHFGEDQAILFCGPHGVGKSEAIYQIAAMLRDDIYRDEATCITVGNLLKNEGKMGDLVRTNDGKWHYDFGLPVIERRLSQMSEGELTGIPQVQENQLLRRETTKFTQMDFLSIAYEYPVVLFFDEINRAFTSLRQGTFQIADSKIFLGNKLHQRARVFVAANIGPLYQAEDFDIAEFSRYATFMINYNSEAWIKWATRSTSGVHQLVTDFISKDTNALYVDGTNFQPNNKYPDPRAWTRLGRLLTQKDQMGVLPHFIDSPMLMFVASSMVGQEEGQRFAAYCKENAFYFGVKDILNSWPEISKRLPNKRSEENRRRLIIMELFHKVQKCYDDLDTDFLMESDPAKINNFKTFLSEVPSELIATLAMLALKANSSSNEKIKNTKRNQNTLMVQAYTHIVNLTKNALKA